MHCSKTRKMQRNNAIEKSFSTFYICKKISASLMQIIDYQYAYIVFVEQKK